MIIVCIVLSCASVFAQDSTRFRKFYVEVGGGYCFPFPNDELESPRDEVGTLNYLMRPDSSVSVRPVQSTLGQGWKGSLNVGYMFHKSIGLEFQFNYVHGDNILMSKTESPTYVASHHLMSQRFEVIPQLVLNHQIKRWGIYSKSGPIIPVGGHVESTIEVSDKEGRTVEKILGFAVQGIEATVKAKARTNPRASYGFQTRLGLSFDATSWLAIYVEASYAALSVRAKETITEQMDIELVNTNAGVTENYSAEDLDAIDLNSNYLDELTETSNNPEYNPNADPSKPLDEPAFKDNFNHLGVNFGLRFRLF